MKKTLAASTAVALAYDVFVRPKMLDWGATDDERHRALPGDEIVAGVMDHHTRALTIDAPPEAVWPWLVQIGDRRGGFYSYDWVERFVFPGTVHYVEGTHSATRIHPELQDVNIGDHIDTGSVGGLAIGNPVTVLNPNRALVIGTWAFVLEPLAGQRTRLLVRDATPDGCGPWRRGGSACCTASRAWSTTASASRCTSRCFAG